MKLSTPFVRVFHVPAYADCSGLYEESSIMKGIFLKL